MHKIHNQMRKTLRLKALFKKTSSIFATVLVSYIVFFNMGLATLNYYDKHLSILVNQQQQDLFSEFVVLTNVVKGNDQMQVEKCEEVERDNKDTRKQLQLLHIPKNGGSAITDSAIKANIAWGYCRFQSGSSCPDLYDPDPEYRKALKRMLDEVHKLDLSDENKYLWHYPPSKVNEIIKNYKSKMDIDEIIDPYKDSDLFVVVRNPYDRLVSAYYHWESMHHPVETLNSIGLMNRLIGESLDAVKADYLYRGGHYIPQYDFVFDHSTSDNDLQSNGCKNQFHREHRRRIVKYILRHDYLRDDFDKLVNMYGLNITLIDKTSAKRKMHRKATLTRYEINAENLQRIEAFYAKDFDEFGFKRMSSTDRIMDKK